MINHKFVSFSTVQIYDLSYIHLRNVHRKHLMRFQSEKGVSKFLPRGVAWRGVAWRDDEVLSHNMIVLEFFFNLFGTIIMNIVFL